MLSNVAASVSSDCKNCGQVSRRIERAWQVGRVVDGEGTRYNTNTYNNEGKGNTMLCTVS